MSRIPLKDHAKLSNEPRPPLMPQDTVEQFKASVSLFIVILYMIVLVNLISGAIAFLVILVIGFRSSSVVEIVLLVAGFLLCLTMTIFAWRRSAKERCKYLEARRKAKEAYNLTEHESRGFWRKYGDSVIAVVFAVLIPVALILTARYELEGVLAWSLNLACILMFILSLIWFYYHYRPMRTTRVISTIAAFTMIAILFIAATPLSWLEQGPPPGRAEWGACQDNMRTINGEIMVYKATTGEWPDSSMLINTDYFRLEPTCPYGNASYVWHDSVNGEAPYVTCPNVEKYPDHIL